MRAPRNVLIMFQFVSVRRNGQAHIARDQVSLVGAHFAKILLASTNASM
jgi:hypothetical protein